MKRYVHVYVKGHGWITEYIVGRELRWSKDRTDAQAFEVGPDTESLKAFIAGFGLEYTLYSEDQWGE